MDGTFAHAFGTHLKLPAKGGGVWLSRDVEANNGGPGPAESFLANRNPRSHRIQTLIFRWGDQVRKACDPAERPPAGTRTGFVFVILPHLPIKAATIPGGEKEPRGRTPPWWSGVPPSVEPAETWKPTLSSWGKFCCIIWPNPGSF